MHTSRSALPSIELPKFVTVRNLPPWFVEALDNALDIPNMHQVNVSLMTKTEGPPLEAKYQVRMALTYTVDKRNSAASIAVGQLKSRFRNIPMSNHSNRTAELAECRRELPAVRDEPLFDNSTVIGCRDKADFNGELVVAKSATVLPISEQERKHKIAVLRGRVRKEHRISGKLFAKSVRAARSAGEALVELKDLVGHGKWGREKKNLQDKLQLSDTTLSLYMRIYINWDRILAAIQTSQLQDASLRRVATWLSQTTSNVGKDKSPRSLTLTQPASLHQICENRDLAGVISQIERRGFRYHSTDVACEKGGSHLFLVTGVRGGAVAATDELGTWIEVAGREEAISQMTDRLAVVWPGAVLEIV